MDIIYLEHYAFINNFNQSIFAYYSLRDQQSKLS